MIVLISRIYQLNLSEVLMDVELCVYYINRV
jgi:hypothetical protein